MILTGSRAYGKPRDDSDIDLVALVTPDQLTEIKQALLERDSDAKDYHGSISLVSGQINLILETDPDKYEAWDSGTEQLRARAPVTRKEAVEVFETLFAELV